MSDDSQRNEDWHSELDIQGKIGLIYQKQVLNDVAIKVTNGSNTEVLHANRFVLALASPFFFSMFTRPNWTESTGEIVLEEIDPEIFQLFLQYVYYNEFQMTSVKKAVELYTLGDRFLVKKLKQWTLKTIQDNMDYSNICFLYCFAKLYDLKELEENCLEKIQYETEKILDLNYFDEIELEHILIILSQNYLSMSEFKVFGSVMDWIKYKSDKGDEISPENKDAISQKICFLNMTNDELKRIINSGLLTEEEFKIINNYKNGSESFPSKLTTNIRINCYLLKLNPSEICYEDVKSSAITFNVDKDIVLNGIQIWTRFGRPDQIYSENLKFVIYCMGQADFTSIDVKKKLHYSSKYIINMNVVIKKNKSYWMCLKSPNKNRYRIVKLEGLSLNFKNIKFRLSSDLLPNYSPHFPLSSILFAPL